MTSHRPFARGVVGEERGEEGVVLSDIKRGLLLDAGAALKLAKGTAERLLENLRSRIAQEAEALYVEVETENAQIANARAYLSATLAGESRCLRTVLHTVIKEMTKQTA